MDPAESDSVCQAISKSSDLVVDLGYNIFKGTSGEGLTSVIHDRKQPFAGSWAELSLGFLTCVSLQFVGGSKVVCFLM